MNQKEAVFEVIKDVKRGLVDTDKPTVLSKQEKQLVAQKLFEGFKKGRIAYNHEMPSDDKLLLYISGLVSNWLRKDKRLNGQRTYVPGTTRRPVQMSLPVPTTIAVDPGMSNEQLRALQALAQGTGDVQVFVIRRAMTPTTNSDENK